MLHIRKILLQIHSHAYTYIFVDQPVTAASQQSVVKPASLQSPAAVRQQPVDHDATDGEYPRATYIYIICDQICQNRPHMGTQTKEHFSLVFDS